MVFEPDPGQLGWRPVWPAQASSATTGRDDTSRTGRNNSDAPGFARFQVSSLWLTGSFGSGERIRKHRSRLVFRAKIVAAGRTRVQHSDVIETQRESEH